MTAESAIRPLAPEKLLIDTLPQWLENVPGAIQKAALVVSPGRAQLASRLFETQRFEGIQAWYLDLHDAAQTAAICDDSVDVLCGADLPEDEFQLVALPVLKRAEAELTRDLLQQAHMRLCEGGYLVASVNNPKDNWLHSQLQILFDKVTTVRDTAGCVYWARKTKALRKIRDFSCEFSFRDEERLIQVVSRPGVFSHRRLDSGARQLMLSAEITATDNVMDLGCGAGAVALAAAARTHGQVFGVDANARAIACLKRGAELNGLDNIVPIWNADGNLDLPVAIDLVLANPPYFGDDRISQHFVDTGVSVLRPGGALLVVTKSPNWFEAYFEQSQLEDIVILEASRYWVVCGRMASQPSAPKSASDD